jgi:predicted O-methyltransferase YrrM
MKKLKFYNEEDIEEPINKYEAYATTGKYQVSPLLKELYSTLKTEVKNGEILDLSIKSGYIRPYLGYILYRMVKDNKLKKVLDIGTGYGFSSLFMLEGLPEDGILTTIDKDQELLYKNGGLLNLNKTGKFNQVEFYEEDSKTLLPKFYKEERFFDLVFLDAGKLFDEQINDILLIDHITKKNSIIVVKNFSKKFDKLYGIDLIQKDINFYLKANYKHWFEIENNFSKHNAMIFVKISEDIRDWDYHIEF